MKNGWLVFTATMCVLSVAVIVAYAVLEIMGISIGWKSWSMIAIGTFLWVLLFMESYKKRPNG